MSSVVYYSCMRQITSIVLGCTLIFSSFPSVLSAQEATISRNLTLGDRGSDIVLLQKFLNRDSETKVADSGPGSPGLESDYFGSFTRSAVMKFQYKYRSEVLYPAGLLAPTGYVGTMTRAKMANLGASGSANAVAQAAPQTSTTSLATAPGMPLITGVSPTKVRRGDTVTVTGENFTTTGNAIIIADGLLSKKFTNLSSPNGKTFSFVYAPPPVDTVTEADIRALPPEAIASLETTLTKAGGTLSDLWTSNKSVTNEAELKAFLERNGHSFDEMYNYFWIKVRNSNGGEWESQGPMLYGLRAFPFDTIADVSSPSILSRIGATLSGVVGNTLPLVYAADYGGGFNLGKTISCDCSDGYITFQLSYGGKGLGTFFYYYGSGFRPASIGTAQTPNMWLGMFTTLGAPVSCWKQASYICIPIPANKPKSEYMGFSLWPSF